MNRLWKTVLIISLICNLGIIYVAHKALEYRGHINEWLDKYVNVVEEFSGRQYYLIDNKRLNSDVPVPNRVVFFGTQLIKNWDVPSLFPEYEVINRGIPGQRAAGLLLRFRPDVIELKPRVVVLEISSYNLRVPQSLEEIQDYFICLVDLAQRNDIIPVALTMLPIMADSAFVFENDDYKIADSIVAYNAWLNEYCTRQEILLTDAFAPLADSRGFLDLSYAHDAINPNRAGYEKITANLRLILEKVFGAR